MIFKLWKLIHNNELNELKQQKAAMIELSNYMSLAQTQVAGLIDEERLKLKYFDIINNQEMSSFHARNKTSDSCKESFNKSFKTQEDSLLCNSCKLAKEEFQSKIAELKDKAHQSFMQVLQIQQLHDEEMSLMREEFDERDRQGRGQAQRLEKEVGRLREEARVLQRNGKRHNYDFEGKELVIENIETIYAEEESYLDESELLQFKDIISTRNGIDYVSTLRKEIYKDFKFVSNNKMQIEKLFIFIKEVKDENIALLRRNEELTAKLDSLELQIKSWKHTNEGLNREIKFITEQVKRLGNDKLKFERKLNEIERVKSHENSSSNSPARKLEKASIATVEPLSPKYNTKSISMLEVSKFSELEESKREINELNYAKFMMEDEVEVELPNFKKRGSNQLQDRK